MADKYDKMHKLFPEDSDNESDGIPGPGESNWIEYRTDADPFVVREQPESENKDELGDTGDIPANTAGGRPQQGTGNGDGAPARRDVNVPQPGRGAVFPPEGQGRGHEERDYRPVRFRRDRRTGCMGGIMYAVFVISASIILACIGWMAASDVLALNKEEVTATITVPKNFDIDDVATALKDGGIIEYEFLFKFYSKISNSEEKIAPGTYELSSNFDYRAIVKKMYVGSDSMVVTRLTFPEGYTMEQVFDILEENDICSADELYEAAANFNYNYSYLGDITTGDSKRLEGFLFPDTYDFYQGEQASSVINKMLLNLYNRLTADMFAQAENLGITFTQAVNIASMIEKEAANDEERPIIASVIYNRLKIDMPLQIDATIQYILPERKAYLTEADTQIDDPYNTYMYTGLPPGAISNPGIASIKAALQPADTNYFYYALDLETGTHKFFTNYNEAKAFSDTQDYASQG